MIPIIGDIVEGLLGKDGPVNKLLSLIPDPNERAKQAEELRLKILDIAANSASQQLDVNKVEAASASIFVAGWRPAVGWVCASALAWQYVIDPLATWILGVLCAWKHVSLPALPALDSGALMTLLTTMLGFGGLRTFEKLKNVSREQDPK